MDDRESCLFTATVHRKEQVGSLEGSSKNSGKTQVKTQVKTPEQILRLLSENPSMTLAEVAREIGKSLSAVERASTKLVKGDQMKYIGPKKGGHWEIIEKMEK